jgi:hypothetical protein
VVDEEGAMLLALIFPPLCPGCGVLLRPGV